MAMSNHGKDVIKTAPHLRFGNFSDQWFEWMDNLVEKHLLECRTERADEEKQKQENASAAEEEVFWGTEEGERLRLQKEAENAEVLMPGVSTSMQITKDLEQAPKYGETPDTTIHSTVVHPYDRDGTEEEEPLSDNNTINRLRDKLREERVISADLAGALATMLSTFVDKNVVESTPLIDRARMSLAKYTARP